jgi:hypothetical protein
LHVISSLLSFQLYLLMRSGGSAITSTSSMICGLLARESAAVLASFVGVRPFASLAAAGL